MVRASASQQGLHFCEDLFNGIEVWRVGGQEQEFGFGRADGGANGAALMTSEVVHDDNVAWREDREENLLDISAEASGHLELLPGHAATGQPRCVQVMPIFAPALNVCRTWSDDVAAKDDARSDLALPSLLIWRERTEDLRPNVHRDVNRRPPQHAGRSHCPAGRMKVRKSFVVEFLHR